MLEASEWSRSACGNTASKGTRRVIATVPWTCGAWCGAVAFLDGLGVGVSDCVTVTGSTRLAGRSQDIPAHLGQEESRTEHLRAALSAVCAEFWAVLLWAVLHSLTGTSPTPSSGLLLQVVLPLWPVSCVFQMFVFILLFEHFCV